MPHGGSEAEWQTRKTRINAKLREIVNAPVEQQEIMRRVEGLFALADQLEERFRQACAQVDKLTPSLLARAFRGQLVAQDPTDEPAEKLLERIRQRGSR